MPCLADVAVAYACGPRKLQFVILWDPWHLKYTVFTRAPVTVECPNES